MLGQIVRRDHSDECIGYSEVGSNQGSTPELVLFHGIFFLLLCLRAPTLNNAVYVISVSQALITMAQSERSVTSVFSCRFSVSFYFSKSPHHSVNLNFYCSSIKRSTEKTQLESCHYPSNLNFARPNSSGRVGARPHAPRWKALLCQIVPA